MFQPLKTHFSFLSRNCIDCDCTEICHESGGHFLPNLSLGPLLTVRQYSVRSRFHMAECRAVIERPHNAVLFPGTFLVIRPSLPAISGAPNAIVEIQIQTDEFDFSFTRTFGSASGVTCFVYSMATPNLLLTETPQVYFAALIEMYSK
jgi:hypothetical protein